MAELLLEILSEEIPARMQARAAQELCRLVTERLTGAGLAFSQARAFVTPRRLALVVDGLPKRQPDAVEEKKGPRLDAPVRAIEGFLKGHGLASIDAAEVRETDKGTFYFAVKRVKGQASAKVLPGVIAESIQALSWPKSMRWGETRFAWVRPLHGVLAVFDGRRLAGALELGNGAVLAFGNTTRGHRFLKPGKFRVTGFADYEAKLEQAKVILDPAKRRAAILKQARQKAARAKLELPDDPALLDEVTGLVEWPVVLLGRIEERFMDLPPEVLTTAMRAHQKYLALTDKDGNLAPRFLVVANMESADKGKAIAAGNERVLRARLADARFFWDQDRKQSLAARTPRLGDIVFHAKLGSLDEKIDRVQALAVEIAGYVPGADKDRVRSAARLAKADLVTGMVGEFPELQGIMGRYYALADGEHPEVADAIAEHYAPQGPGDACPGAPVSVAVALADKIDTLAAFFRIDEKPTGSRDPFALRRAALGVIRLIVENQVRLPLRRVVESAKGLIDHTLLKRGSQASLSRTVPGWGEIDTTVLAVLDFFADRLKVALRERGVRHDLIAAVFALGGEDDLVRLLARVEALGAFLGTDDGEHLLVAHQRAANIVRIEEKRDKTRYESADLSNGKLVQVEEKRLAIRILNSESDAQEALAREDFTGAMAALANLRGPVDDFFDKVTVNTEDPDLRANRLRLLARIGETLNHVADFSKIEG
ncbi:MAG: glycine--tRNA ligase subunit beta [Proteobacteria bacterium]|nr:glycine--tRNA ligase subunit beta [Pseudomonadota bacterium]